MVIKQEHNGQMFMFPMSIEESEFAPKDTRLWKEFLIFHQQNLHVYEIFKTLVKQMARKGFEHFGCRSFIEKIRWEIILGNENRDAEFKINNNHGPYYAWLYMLEHPEMKGFFRIRKVRET